MSTKKATKLKTLLNRHRQGTVSLAKWLESLGISHNLQKRYRESRWLEAIGPGAFKRFDDEINWQGGLYAVQQQAGLPIHVGALTALAMQGLGHYFRTSNETIFLFSGQGMSLPRWFVNYSWGSTIQHVKTSMFSTEIGLMPFEEKNFSITTATPERAILECLYLAPAKLDLVECYHLMEGLSNLRPHLVQKLLENCSSIKVKRLFLFLATKAQHQWLSFLDKEKIDLGKGDRSITKGGVYNARFHITIPKEIA